MTAECNGCGACCNPVVMPYGPADLRDFRLIEAARADPDELDNLLFARAHFTVINRREGLQRAAYLSEGGKTTCAMDADSRPIVAWSFFYSCDRFDPETRSCTDYENRPPLCRDYPFYGAPLDDPWNKAKALPETCAFRADIGQPVVPVALSPTHRKDTP